MFVVQNQFNIHNESNSLQTKSLYKTGARELKKLNSFPVLHCIRLVLQRAPILFNSIFFKMQNLKKNQKPSSEDLCAIKQELESLDPNLKRLKVKPYFTKGKINAHADLGHRRIYVRGNVYNVIAKFILQYQERYPTACFNTNTI